jgi:hypothetical protein
MTEILETVRYGIENVRSALGLLTKWKTSNDKTNLKLLELLKILEWR